MIFINKITDFEQIKSVMEIPKLFQAAMTDEDLVMAEQGTWEPRRNADYVGVYDEATLIGIARFEEVSNITTMGHFFINPKYWGTGLANEIYKKVLNYLKDNTQYSKVITETPRSCEQVLQFLTRNGFKIEGMLTNAIIWRNELTHLVILGQMIRSQ